MQRVSRTALIQHFMGLFLGFAVVTGVLSANSGNAGQGNRPDCVLAAYYPPFVIADTNTNAGLSIEILRAAAERTGRTIAIEMMPFQRALYELQSDRHCMLPALFRNASREAQFQWIETYHAAELQFLTTIAPVNSLEEGRALNRIAVETDASADQFLTSMGFDNLVRIANPASSARMLQAGRVDAWAQSAIAANGVWDDLNLSPRLLAGAPIYAVPVYVTAGLRYPKDLAEIYREAIQSLVADGTVLRILENYD